MPIFKKLKILNYFNILLSSIIFLVLAYDNSSPFAVVESSIWLVVFVASVISFVIYCHWLYQSYTIYLENKINSIENKPLFKKPIIAVLLTSIPVVGQVILANISRELFFNTSRPTSKMMNDNILFSALWIFLFFSILTRTPIIGRFFNVPSMLPIFCLSFFLPALAFICIRSQEKNIELLVPKKL
jgi:hypothetical protein